MSYYCELKIHFIKGTSEDIKRVVDYLESIALNDDEGKATTQNTFKIDGNNIYTDNSMTESAQIWGDETLNPQPDLYVRIAEKAPTAEWSMESFRVDETGGYGQTYLEGKYCENMLQYKMMTYVDRFSLNTLIEDAYDMYCDETSDDEQMEPEDFVERFSYETLCNYYSPDGTITADNFNELVAEDFPVYCTEDNDVSLEGWWDEKQISIE